MSKLNALKYENHSLPDNPAEICPYDFKKGTAALSINIQDIYYEERFNLTISCIIFLNAAAPLLYLEVSVNRPSALADLPLQNMSVLRSSKSKPCCILENCKTAVQFLHLRAFHQIAGYPDYIAVAGIEGQVSQILVERAFNNIQYKLRILMHCHVNREDVTGSGWEILVESAQHFQLVNQFLWFLTNRNPGSR